MNTPTIAVAQDDPASPSQAAPTHPTDSPRGRTTLGSQLAALWPGLPSLGFAALLAWQLLLADTGTWISNVDAEGAALVSGSLLIGLQANLFSLGAVVLLASVPLQNHFRRLLESRYFTFAASFTGILGVASVIFSGPYFFAGPNMLNIQGLFSFGAAVCGIAYGMLILKSAKLFSNMEPAKVLVYYLLADLVAGLVYSVIMCNNFYAPFEGSPPLSGIIGLFVLPTVSALLLNVKVGGGTPQTPAAVSRGIRGLPSGFWKLLAALAVFSLATSFACGWSAQLESLQHIQTSSRLLVLAEMAFDVALLLMAVRFLKHIAFDKLYLLAMVGIALALTVYPMLDAGKSMPSLLVEFLVAIFNLVIWCLLSYVAFKREASAMAVFGLGYGCIAAGKALGWNLSRTFFALRDTINVEIVSLGLAIIVLVFVAVVFNARDFAAIFSPDAETEFNLRSLISHLTRQQRGSSPTEAKHGGQPWKKACARLAQETGLSARETQIMELLSKNMSAEQIASTLVISTNTVRTHTHNIYAKLDVHSRQELVERVKAHRAPEDARP